MDAETGFTIDGTLYPIPDLGTFNMDEAQILYDYSGLAMEDFVVPDDEDDDDREVREHRLKNPGFLRALMHIAYQRGNPDVRAARVKALVGNATVISAWESLVPDVEEDEVPLDGTKQPSESSANDWDDSNGNSGGGSISDSDEQDADPSNTGTMKSGISPTYDPTTLDE